MTKQEYIHFIKNSLPQVDKTSKFHYEQIASAINVAINQVFYDIYDKNPKAFKKSLERYTIVRDYAGVTDPTVQVDTGRYGMTLNVDIVDLPRKTGGIFDVLSGSDNTTTFVPVSVLEGNQFYGSESSLPGTIVGYAWDGARSIEFWNMSASEASAGVKIRLIQQFKSYGSGDNVVLPYGQDQRIIEMVREFLGLPPKDLVNNNADINNG